MAALNKVISRGFASQAAKPSLIQRLFFEVPTQNPLNEEFPGVPAITGKKAAAADVQVSKLANGLTFASVDRNGAAASVGVYAKAGSRYEALPGTAAMLQQAAFFTTQKRSTAKLYRDIEDMGASVSASNGREVFAYNGSALRGNVDGLVSVLSEVVTQPKLWSWEIDEAKQLAAELNAERAADPKNAALEAVHAAAFGESSPLGHSRFASSDDLEGVSAETLRAFLGQRFSANKMVIAATNVDHHAFADALDKYFLSLPEGTPETASQKPVVVGGENHSRVKGASVSHVAVALEAPGLNAGADKVHALGVLQALLGSTGSHGHRAGPSSHSRIARSIHNDAHSFIRSLEAFALPYSDAGLVGLVGSSADHEAGRLVDAMAGFLKDAASLAITDAELARAKALYKLRLAMQAEGSACGAKDDIAHQILLSGKRVALADSMKAVDAVTASSVQAIAKAALQTNKPSIAAVGTLSTVPRYDVFASALLK